MTVGITFGTFDLIYSGYIEMLKEAKTKCDYLIVGLQTDPSVERPEKNQPIQSLNERYFELKDCELVDEIITYTQESELEEILRKVKIDVRIIGEEYKNREFTGKSYCQKHGIQIHFNPRSTKIPSEILVRNNKNKKDHKEAFFYNVPSVQKLFNRMYQMHHRGSYKNAQVQLS